MSDVVCDVMSYVVCDVMSDVVFDGVCDVVCNVVCDGVNGDVGRGKVEWLILCCLGVFTTDRQTDGRTDIGGCRDAFATENNNTGIWDIFDLI